MTDLTASPAASAPKGRGSLLAQDEHTRRRNAAEKRFEIYGMIAVSLGVLALIERWRTVRVLGGGRA